MKQRTYYKQIYWDQLQAARAGAPQSADIRDHIAVFRRHIAPSARVLDVGCGPGITYAPALRQYAGQYVGVDLSLHALRQAHQRLQGVQVDLEQPLPFAGAQFDAVVCMEVLEHLFDPAELLRHIRAVLKPAGILIVSVPNIAHIAHRVRLLGGKFVAGGHPQTADTPWCDAHIRFFTRRALLDLLRATAFVPVRTYGTATALLTGMPVLSVVLGRLLGRQRLHQISDWLHPLGYWWPDLFAGHLIVVAHYGDETI